MQYLMPMGGLSMNLGSSRSWSETVGLDVFDTFAAAAAVLNSFSCARAPFCAGAPGLVLGSDPFLLEAVGFVTVVVVMTGFVTVDVLRVWPVDNGLFAIAALGPRAEGGSGCRCSCSCSSGSCSTNCCCFRGGLVWDAIALTARSRGRLKRQVVREHGAGSSGASGWKVWTEEKFRENRIIRRKTII